MIVNYNEKITKRYDTDIEFNFNDTIIHQFYDKVKNATNAIMENGNIDNEQKAKKIESLSIEKYAKNLVQDILNAIISTVIFCDKEYVINDKLVNLDKKRINGKSVIAEIESFKAEINEFLTTGYVTIDNKVIMVRNTQYTIKKTEKARIYHEYINMKKFNLLSREEKNIVKNSKEISFKGYSIK